MCLVVCLASWGLGWGCQGPQEMEAQSPGRELRMVRGVEAWSGGLAPGSCPKPRPQSSLIYIPGTSREWPGYSGGLLGLPQTQ